MSSNWIFQKDGVNSLSNNDKLKALIKLGEKLVLVQFHEVQRLYTSVRRDKHSKYVDYLYEHYIVKGLPKTYIKK